MQHDRPQQDSTAKEYFKQATGKRINTDSVVARALSQQYPNLELVIVPAGNCKLLAYANAGFASYEPIKDPAGDLPSLKWDFYVPPAHRLDGAAGVVAEELLFGKFMYKWKNDDFIVYLADGRDGDYGNIINFYILATNKQRAQQLVLEAGSWSNDLHDEIWVFDGGYWSKDGELFQSVMKSSWDVVILNPDMKSAIIDDHLSFFRSREIYRNLQVPWKRGIIYHGPPGNGKTISIKATMHMLYNLEKPVLTLYVRSLVSWNGPQYAIKQIFWKARQLAPCYLIFEDLDSLITDDIRSYFLNEVDGLTNNDGIFMVGSTNHLERLDPGLAKRPSRFDRKYFFPDPNLEERIAYCHFWQSKLAENKDIEFPDKLCTAIAEITDEFSFAYIQEAFVAALLAIAKRTEKSRPSGQRLGGDIDDEWVGVGCDDDDDLDCLVLWVEIKKQIEILREGIDKDKE